MVRGMRVKSGCWLMFFLACALVSAGAQSAPQEALEEFATADKIETVLKHLPVKVEDYFQKLPAKEKAAFAEKLPSKSLEREGGKLTRSDDGGWVLQEKKDGKDK